jgi:hypothetical protein
MLAIHNNSLLKTLGKILTSSALVWKKQPVRTPISGDASSKSERVPRQDFSNEKNSRIFLTLPSTER